MQPHYPSSRPQFSSAFSYNLSRPYPFRWFTWVVVIGGVIAAVLFSILNLAANGYVARPVYTTNPNGTLAKSRWYEKAPWSWTNKLSASCESQNLAVGTTFFTSNLGLSYTLIRLYQNDSSDGTTNDQPAVPYLNSTLKDCSIAQIDITLQRDDSSVASGDWWSWGRTKSTATALCIIDSGEIPMQAELKTTFAINPTAPAYSSIWVRLDNQTAASQWWGSHLLTSYYGALTGRMAKQKYENGTYDSGHIILSAGDSTEFESLGFFNFTFNFRNSDGPIFFPGTWNYLPMSAWKMAPSIASEVDGFAKSFYSAVLVDLGQNKTPNALTDPDALQYLFHRETNMSALGNSPIKMIGPPGNVLINESYATFQKETGPLGIKPATIHLQYACSVPERKDAGSLFIGILIADLVFLQALYQLLNWAASSWVSKKDPTWNHCPGCKQQYSSDISSRKESEFSLLPLKNKRTDHHKRGLDDGQPSPLEAETPVERTHMI